MGSGTATPPGSLPMTITATDGSTGSGSPFTVAGNYTFAVASPTIMLTPAALPGGVAGNAYSQAITASGGVGPYTFAVTVGSLPAGLNLASNGTLARKSVGEGKRVTVRVDIGGGCIFKNKQTKNKQK